MSSCHVMRFVSFGSFICACCGFLVQTEKDVFGIDQRNDAIEIDGAAKAIIDPEQRS